MKKAAKPEKKAAIASPLAAPIPAKPQRFASTSTSTSTSTTTTKTRDDQAHQANKIIDERFDSVNPTQKLYL
jgi:hypothetical protein